MTTTPELPELLPCPFCKRVPTIRQWPGRELKILAHKCQIVDYDVCGFPKDMPAKAMVWNKHIEDALAALAVTKTQEAVEGWKLVPVEPTEAMKQAGYHAPHQPGLPGPYHAIPVYKAMVAAAPQPAQPALRDLPENDCPHVPYVDEIAQPAPVPAKQAHPQYVAQLIKERDAWQEEAKAKRGEVEHFMEQLRTRAQHQDRDVWFWQGDGEDHLESMGRAMVVVIRADQLRSLVAAPSSPEPDKYDISNAKTAYWASHCPDCAKPTAEGHIHTCSPQVEGAQSAKDGVRKTSEMSHSDAVRAVSDFASKVKRWMETSEDFSIPGPSQDSTAIVVKILVSGRFGAAEGFFEGMRVLGGHKLPAKEVAKPHLPAHRNGVPCEECDPTYGCVMNCGPSASVGARPKERKRPNPADGAPKPPGYNPVG